MYAALVRQAIAFEKENGTHALLKAGMSALNKLLVEKGVCTEKELQEALVKELMDWDNE